VTTFRVLGIDPGTSVTGYAVVEPQAHQPGHLVECGIVRTNAKHDIHRRLGTLFDGISDVIGRTHPEVLALETVFYGKNVRTTVALGQVRGVALLAAAKADLAVAEFAPARVKKCVTGEGSAAKEQVGYMVQQLLRLQAPPAPSDAADACAIALTYVLTGGVRV
jgi:crossover junction endodeoxyribonuclease RuvC